MKRLAYATILTVLTGIGCAKQEGRPCGECTAGVSSCEGNAVIACVTVEGCTYYADPQQCPSDTHCGSGVCLAAADDCPIGARECDGNAVRECVNSPDGAVWSSPASCPSNASCSLGECVIDDPCADGGCPPPCSDECLYGITECDGTSHFRTCGDYDADACTEWSDDVYCGSSSTCSAGYCVDPADLVLDSSSDSYPDSYYQTVWAFIKVCNYGSGPSAKFDVIYFGDAYGYTPFCGDFGSDRAHFPSLDPGYCASWSTSTIYTGYSSPEPKVFIDSNCEIEETDERNTYILY